MIHIVGCNGPMGAEDQVYIESAEDWDLDSAIRLCHQLDALIKQAEGSGLSAYEYHSALAVARGRIRK